MSSTTQSVDLDEDDHLPISKTTDGENWQNKIYDKETDTASIEGKHIDTKPYHDSRNIETNSSPCDKNGNIRNDTEENNVKIDNDDTLGISSVTATDSNDDIDTNGMLSCLKSNHNDEKCDTDDFNLYHDDENTENDIANLGKNMEHEPANEQILIGDSDELNVDAQNDRSENFGDKGDGILNFFSCGKTKLFDEDSEPFSFPSEATSPKPKRGIQSKVSKSFRKVKYEIKSKFDKPKDRDANLEENSNSSKTKEMENINEQAAMSQEETYILADQATDLERLNNSSEQTGGNFVYQTNIQSHPSPERKSIQTVVNPDQYDFTHTERGYMVIIVNDRFKRQSFRDGSHMDLINMKTIARKFGFRLFNKQDKNLTREETLTLLREAQQYDHSNCDSFLFMISTHGLEQPNPRANGKPDHALVCADDRMVFTSTIIEMFNDENCPSLKDKPKFFFIQACRGDDLDYGSDVFVVQPKQSIDKTCGFADGEAPACSTESSNRLRKKESFDESDTRPGADSWLEGQTQQSTTPSFIVPKKAVSYPSRGLPLSYTRQQHIQSATSHQVHNIYAPTPYAIVDTPSLKCDNDMLVMYAIPQGMFAWRNTNDGSWMIYYLYRVLMAYDMTKQKNFLNLLTQVSAIMSERSTNTPSNKTLDQKKAVPVIEHKLTKDVIFLPKAMLSDWVKVE